MSEVFVITAKAKENADTDADVLYWNAAQVQITRSGWTDKLCEAQIYKNTEDADKWYEYLVKAVEDVSEEQKKRVMIENVELKVLPKKQVVMAKLKGI